MIGLDWVTYYLVNSTDLVNADEEKKIGGWQRLGTWLRERRANAARSPIGDRLQHLDQTLTAHYVLRLR